MFIAQAIRLVRNKQGGTHFLPARVFGWRGRWPNDGRWQRESLTCQHRKREQSFITMTTSWQQCDGVNQLAGAAAVDSDQLTATS